MLLVHTCIDGQLKRPTASEIIWNFTFLDTIMEDAMNAIQLDAKGHVKPNVTPLLCLCDLPPFYYQNGKDIDINTLNIDERIVPFDDGNLK